LSAFAAAVSAAPAPIIDERDAALESLNITETLDRDLRNGEMIVFGNGGRSEFKLKSSWHRAVLTPIASYSCYHYGSYLEASPEG
jgi:hypothetical protein